MNRLRGMPAGGFVVCGFVVCDFVVCGFVVCGTGGACDVERWGRKKSVRALKKTGCPHGRPVRFCHRSFHRREFFGFRGDGSVLEMVQRCLAMSGFAQCRPLCGAVPRCFLSGATPANGQISIALALEQAALRWLLSRRYRVGSRTGHKGITACARPGRPREIPVPGFSFWRPGG